MSRGHADDYEDEFDEEYNEEQEYDDSWKVEVESLNVSAMAKIKTGESLKSPSETSPS